MSEKTLTRMDLAEAVFLGDAVDVVEGGRMVAFVSIGDLVKHRLDKIEAEADAMRVYIQQA